MTWPKLCQRWGQPATTPGPRFTPGERAAIWDHATRAARAAAAEIRALAGTDPAAAADAAWAASGTLHAAAAALGSRILRQAADSYDRAARAPCARIPVPTPAGGWLRDAARLLGTLAASTRNPALAPLVLLGCLASLAEAVAQLREVQQHAAQAAAARAAAEVLRIPTRGSRVTAPPAPRRSRTPGQIAAEDSPSLSAGASPGPGRTALARTGRLGHATPHGHPARVARVFDS